MVGLLTLLIPVSVVNGDSVVTFPDPNLEAAIRSAINKPTGDIYQSDLSSLTQLIANYAGIVDLTGLEYCTSLTNLSLAGNQIDNISRLSGLTSLDWVQLPANKIGDISPLSGLTGLTWLTLYGNQISDISPLTGLTNLSALGLSSNQITDISAISGLTKLKDLNLDHNQVVSIQPLVNNPGMTSGVVYLLDNPLDSASINTYIPTLQEKGVTVYCGTTSQPPNQPTNTYPANGATGISPNEALQSSAFSDPDSGDIHNATEWWIACTANSNSGGGGYAFGGLTSTKMFSLNYSTTYYWRVRYQDNHEDRSDWSSETSFTTAAAPPPNQPPNRPSNISPANGATGISLTPTLQSSAFSDSYSGDFHDSSQWQVTTTAGNYSSPVYDSNTDASHLTSIVVPSLSYFTTYYWHVRYQDNRGSWSDWSAETSFTVFGPSPPNQPCSIVPPTAATGVSLLATLQSSPFSDPDSGNSHSASQWQVREVSGSYSSPIYDTGTDRASLTIKRIPSGILSQSTTYCWHVRYQDNTGLWSDWSAETFFVTEGSTAERSTTESNGGLPVWIWIVVGAVLIVGAIAYLVGRRPRLGQQTAQTTTGDSRVEQAQKESTSVPDSANTQSKSVPRKGAQWKTVVGWILFAWGLVGLLANIVFILVWGFAPVSVAVNSAVCVLFLLAGWRLSHPTTS